MSIKEPDKTGMNKAGIEKIESMEELLPLVRRPSRYIGGEVNSIRKELGSVEVKFALAFPDAYELGMSHFGFQVLYAVLNSVESIACERVFAPWTDMEALLRSHSVPLATLENRVPLSECDIVGFSLQYELSYTNILNMLDLGGVSLSGQPKGPRTSPLSLPEAPWPLTWSRWPSFSTSFF